ncbi:MAG: Na/Pi symporter [Microscillaceae bacterium]|nr:Na/Pi symporter [Microscillaceae bacterium]
MEGNRWDFFKIFVRLILFIFAFLVLVQWMTLACRQLNRDWTNHLLVATSNPFLALFIGLLITALVQSSSVVISMLVAMVASDTLAFESAVFMVMGANIGTTVTSTFVSLGYVTRRKEFRKAIAAATAHDFFNIFTAVLLLPLEYFFGILSHSATRLADLATLPWEANFFTEINLSLWVFLPIAEYLQGFFVSGLLGLVAAFSLLFLILKNIAYQLQDLLLKKSGYRLESGVLAHPFKSLGLGVLITGLVQSSSLITSLVVPVVASNQLSLKKAFPFIMGANIGTTFTALLAALPASEAALSLAFSHLLFNVFGVLFFFPLPWLRNLPVRLARRLGRATLKNRLIGFSYIMLTFFVVPFFLIFLTKGKITVRQYEYIQQLPVEYPNKGEQGEDTLKKKGEHL